MRFALLLALSLHTCPAGAQEFKAGVFDHYIMALSWLPNWCALEGNARRATQCEAGIGPGWVLHGLWPQYERGWPEHCQSVERPPSREMTADMAKIMGSSGLAWYQWKKHGTCSGLSAPAYFALSSRAYALIDHPEVFEKLTKAVRLPAKVVEEAFLRANPDLEPDMITITCRAGRIEEVRICLSRDLLPVPCGAEAVQECQKLDALLSPAH